MVVFILFLLVERLTASTNKAAVAALIFGLHPVLGEVVQMPSYREDLLCALFILLLRSALAGSATLAFALQPLFLFLALASKESAAIVPLLMSWMWFCFPASRPDRRRCGALLLANIFIVAIYAVVAFGGRPLQAAGVTWRAWL